MSTNSNDSQNSSRIDLIKSLCEIGLETHVKNLVQAYSEQNWKELNEVSLDFEKDCYTIGEVEIVGKIIILRLQLHHRPMNSEIIESILLKIEDLSIRLQLFLIKKLQDLNLVEENKVKYISRPMKTSDLQCPWVYNFCNVQ
jgi:hypothetical protein